MYLHPLIHSELARRRRLDLRRDTDARARSTAEGRRARSPGEASELSRLVPAARDGDADAWEVLVARFTPAIRAVVGGFRLNQADAEDVVQATWARACAHIGRIRQPEAIGGWLTVTARREALRTLQRRQRETLIDEPSHDHRSGHSGPESALLQAELYDALRAAIKRLPDRERAIVDALNYAADSYAHISRSLNIPLGSIGPTRERALARLRRDRDLAALDNAG